VGTKVGTKRRQLVLYHLYTEDEPQYRKAIIRALQRRGFSAFTLMSAVGYGPGQGGSQENVVIIDVATEYSSATDKKIQAIAKDICRDNVQQSVLVVRVPAFPKLVAASRRPKSETSTLKAYLLPTSDSEPDYVGADGQPRPSRKRAAYRGKVLAGFGEWEKHLPKGAIVQGGFLRFFPD
jgi:hypothetical protein